MSDVVKPRYRLTLAGRSRLVTIEELANLVTRCVITFAEAAELVEDQGPETEGETLRWTVAEIRSGAERRPR